MNKFPLIGGSICAVVLLVLASLTNVVGFQTVKSTVVNGSPLFTIRTQRANNQQQNSITSQYLGMGKGNLLQFPIRDNRTEQLKKTIEVISKMDDNTFEDFIKLCIQKARQDINLRDVNSNEIVRVLQLLRKNPKIIINFFINRDNQNITSSSMNTICNWYPGCIIFGFYFVLVVFIAIFIVDSENFLEVLKNLLFPTSASWCRSVQICR